jgi:hypothetical protein
MSASSAVVTIHCSFIRLVVKSVHFLLRVSIQMGGSSSKPPPVQAPEFDATKITAQLPDIEQYEDKVRETIDAASAQASSAWAQAGLYMSAFKGLGWIFLICLLIYVFYYWVYPWVNSHLVGNYSRPPSNDLSITSALTGYTDVKQKVIDKIDIVKGELHIVVNEDIGVTDKHDLTVNYQYPGEAPGSITVKHGDMLDIVPASKAATPSESSSWWNTKNMMTVPKDAKTISTVSVADDGKDSSYGYQFWMYVADWNYKYGEEKHIMSRADSTNSAIKNPLVTLHPTDNTMKISVSIFPETSSSSKAEPAPAGHSGSTDDVYVCEVPNIPLQTWLAVSVTVTTRNLDVYLNGKLVKSCFLSGVPKPVSGSVTLNDAGGFSGWMCSFYHFDKFLAPADAQSFFRSGVPCTVPGTSTNYKVTFGVRDTKGEVVSKYVF